MSNFTLSTSDITGTITKVTVNAAMGSGGDWKLSATVGGTEYISSSSLTTTATDYSSEGTSSGEIIISFSGSAKAVYIKSITVEYASGATTVCSKPTFSQSDGTTFTENLSVELSCATEGATIYYTTDGTDPTTESSTKYESAITINATTTVKAIAVDATSALGNSSVASATYTKLNVLTFSELRSQIETDASSTAKTYAVNLDSAVVTYVYNNYTASIEKDGVGILFYGINTFTAGDILTGTATVTALTYNGVPEITTMTGQTVTSGTAPDPTVVTISDIQNSTSTYLCRYVTVKNATVGTAVTSSNRNGTITDSSSETELTLRSNASTLTADAGALVNVTGIVQIYTNTSGTTTQIIFYEQSQIEVLSMFAFDAETATAIVGQDFTAPTLNNTYTATVTYSSSDESVATVDASTGAITLIAAGETTITATDGTHSDSYTLTVLALTGDGTFDNPYTVEDVKALYKAGITVSDKAWVTGTIIGSVKNATSLYDSGSDVNTNIALNTDANTTTGFIAVQLPSGNLRNIANVKDNTDNIGKEIKVYGTLTTYITDAGVKSTSKIYGLTTIEIKTAEGYATYYNAGCAYEMPEGVKGGLITAASSEGGALTIDYKYGEGDVVPAGSALLLYNNGDGAESYDVVNTSSSASVESGNMLYGASANKDESGNTYVADGYYYYKLTYLDDELGFYWGAENGAGFSMTNDLHAFLAVPAESAAKGFSLADSVLSGIKAAGVGDNADRDSAVYTLSGVRVSGNSLPAGVYIRGGKKFMVK